MKFKKINARLFLDARGEGTPILQIIGEAESSEVLKPALKILNELAPEAVQNVKVIVSDLAGSFVKALRDSFPNHEFKHIKCSWHLNNAWKKQLLPHDAKLYHSLRHLRLIAIEDEFWTYFYKLRHD